MATSYSRKYAPLAQILLRRPTTNEAQRNIPPQTKTMMLLELSMAFGMRARERLLHTWSVMTASPTQRRWRNSARLPGEARNSTSNSTSLEFASPRLRDDSSVVLGACGAAAVKFASDRLKRDQAFILQAIDR